MKFSKIIFFFLLITNCYSQNISSEKLIFKGDKFLEKGNWVKALENYELAIQKDDKNPDLNYKIGMAYLMGSPKSNSLKFFSKAIELNKCTFKELPYWYAFSLHINHQFEKAKAAYKLSDPGNNNAKEIFKRIKECEYGLKYSVDQKDYKITNLGALINTPYPEYLPRITADMQYLYFTSRRPGSTGQKLDIDDSFFEDIYLTKNKGGAWDNAQNVRKLNTEIHEACVGLSDDGNQMFVYKGINEGDLFLSELDGNEWKKPEPLSINSAVFETSPTLSPDGRKMIFVRKQLNASRDLYICTKTIGGNWSKPVKLPSQINTEYDEESPFLHPDGKTLFFSSKGHSSMGGYDIFKSIMTETGWGTPINLGCPINTALDDVYFVLSADGKYGFYSSEKEGGFGRQDIYSIKMPKEYHKPELTLFVGKVTDAVTGQAIEAEIEISNNKSKEVISKVKSNNQTGEYLISLPSGYNYNVTISKLGYLFHSENVATELKEGFKQIKKDVKLIEMKPGASVVLNNIFFSTGKSDLSTESTTELQNLVELLKTTPALKLEISGHTDNVGLEENNLKLSENRAKSVVAFLISQGVPTVKLVAKGYGSSMPLADNNTIEGKQLNRRTEFKVLAK